MKRLENLKKVLYYSGYLFSVNRIETEKSYKRDQDIVKEIW